MNRSFCDTRIRCMYWLLACCAASLLTEKQKRVEFQIVPEIIINISKRLPNLINVDEPKNRYLLDTLSLFKTKKLSLIC